MSTIRGRLITIAIFVLASIAALVPRNVTQRVMDKTTGRMKDTTVRQVPIKRGLDLQGGIHLALEVDESQGPVPDCADRSEEHTSELQSPCNLVCRLLLEKKKKIK